MSGFYGRGEWQSGVLNATGSAQVSSLLAQHATYETTERVKRGEEGALAALRRLLADWPSLYVEPEPGTEHPLAELARLYATEVFTPEAVSYVITRQQQ